jgi:hypothetical protein
MAPTTGIAGSGEPDMALIAELMEDMSRNPPAFAARKLLVEHYISVGWLEAALDNAKELESMDSADKDVKQFLVLLQKKPDLPAPEQKPAVLSAPPLDTRTWDPKTGQYEKPSKSRGATQTTAISTFRLDGDLEPARHDLTQGYQSLRAKAKYIIADLLNLQTLQKEAGLAPSQHTTKIQAITEGHEHSTTVQLGPPSSVRSVARKIRDNPKQANSLAIADFEDTILWIRKPHGKPSGASDDTIRDVLVKRRDTLQSGLPEDLKIHCELALMHMEHEYLNRNYANSETMLGDEVKDIPRANFYVTEDNYAWDMDELVQAITANSGVLRNPLSKEMFTPKDIKGILFHSLGKPLAAMAVQQHEMSKGVRAETITRMEKLSRVLLEDQSSDTLPSRTAVDEFLAYIATCKFCFAHVCISVALTCSSTQS